MVTPSTAVTRLAGFDFGNEKRDGPPKYFETCFTFSASSVDRRRAKMSSAMLSCSRSFMLPSLGNKKTAGRSAGPRSRRSGLRRSSRLHDRGPIGKGRTAPTGGEHTDPEDRGRARTDEP